MATSYSNQENALSTHVLVVSPVDIPYTIVEDWRAQCRQLADFLGTPVELCRLDGVPDGGAVLAAVHQAVPAGRREVVEPGTTAAQAPMSAAPFVWRPDGRPDWRAMWTTFCELALFGGPPHRGPESALAGGPGAAAPGERSEAVEEIRRGIYETTGLYSEPAAPGWLAVTCDSPRMAAWLCATIILENVEARSDEERLLVPADPSFALEDQVKSVITVVAKTHHYWSAHTAGR
jgi:sirohydrochlorin cobaltochelatase